MNQAEVARVARLLAAECVEDYPGARVFVAPQREDPTVVVVMSTLPPAISGDPVLYPWRFAADPPGMPLPYVVISVCEQDWDTEESRSECAKLKLGELEEVT